MRAPLQSQSAQSTLMLHFRYPLRGLVVGGEMCVLCDCRCGVVLSWREAGGARTHHRSRIAPHNRTRSGCRPPNGGLVSSVRMHENKHFQTTAPKANKRTTAHNVLRR
eukprot:scaffold9657_cov103-Isochrysis_galbana.AAC.1